jgi:hypothetical protein
LTWMARIGALAVPGQVVNVKPTYGYGTRSSPRP